MEHLFTSIGIFFDGGYFAKVNEALEEQYSMCVEVGKLLNYVKGEVAFRYNLDKSECNITECHYFGGRFRVNEANTKHLLFSERKFEDCLIENDVIFHYKHLREIQKDKATTVIEKGIDVWFALEAYELSLIRKFNYVVLITGDADHEMLIKKLKSLKIRVILLTWDLNDQSSTSRLLKEEACVHLELSKECTIEPDLIRQLCKKI